MSDSKIKFPKGLIPIIIFLFTWEIAARYFAIFNKAFFPPPSSVTIEFYHLIKNGILAENFVSSLKRVIIGFVSGSLVGIGMGIIMGYNEQINKTFHPIFSLFYPIPALGWLPILMLWIGISDLLPITIIFICSFFPVLYNTITGIRNVPSEVINVARTLGASEKRILFTVILPLAIPNIFTGLRLEAGMAWRVIIAAEMVAIPIGIGALMIKAESLIRMDIIIVCLTLLSILTLSFEKFFIYLEKKITGKWNE
ncbi:MAG: ABC transporter permease [Deltaproteobacteria bacterium]|nr:MAG: ABC transporter permease [Deltaproteobacteria bacterium]